MVWNWHNGDVLYVRLRTWALDIDLMLIFSLFQAAAEYEMNLFFLVEPEMVLVSHLDKDANDILSVYEILDSDLELLVSLKLPVLTVNGHQGGCVNVCNTFLYKELTSLPNGPSGMGI
jgi:hypothetical protein